MRFLRATCSISMCNISRLICLVALISSCYCAIPDYIHVCKSNDKKLAECIKNSVHSLKGVLATGIPELDVPPLEPLELDEIKLRSNGLSANITQLKVWGASNFEIKDLRANIPKNRFAFIVTLPKLNFAGRYEIDAKFVILNLLGEGPVSGNFTDYAFSAVLKGNRIQHDGQEFLKFDGMDLNITIGHSYIVLENLFNGNAALGKAANDAINDSNDILLNEIRPPLQRSLAAKFTDISNKITLKFSTAELFP
ncbi:PREDICTED: uncharacterized protein LOC108565359 [Nicrophorus vespilloides]|uniref:Uncharacterized protein LOC108565359 n=1 Tax=Nicrophorus vespilloides TaxID=110193 RepID=A0ABM1N0C1_NICVS|nr:PREDICTED: uncharacterized protein LOC108565359 [Nicrophorus vespilloides]